MIGGVRRIDGEIKATELLAGGIMITGYTGVPIAIGGAGGLRG